MEWIFLELAEHDLYPGAVAVVDCFLEVIVGVEEALQTHDDGILPVGAVAGQADGVAGFRAVVDELLPFDAVTNSAAGVELPEVVAVEVSEVVAVEVSQLDAADGPAVVDSPQAVSVAVRAVPYPVEKTAGCSYHTPAFDWAYRYDLQQYQSQSGVGMVRCLTVPELEGKFG